MGIAMSNALALMCWHTIRFWQDFSSRDFIWLLIGAGLAVIGMWMISRRKRGLLLSLLIMPQQRAIMDSPLPLATLKTLRGEIRSGSLGFSPFRTKLLEKK